MRESLKSIDGRRMSFRGIFERYGIKSNWHGFPERTVLLKDIRNANGIVVCDHLWFNHTKGFQGLGELKAGDIIEFQARAAEYVKGYVNNREYVDERETDYKLNNPTRFRKVRP